MVLCNTINSHLQINVALAYLKSGNFTARRGTSLPVTVSKRSGKDYITFAAKSKHAAFNKKFVDFERDYVLLYSDFEPVVQLPGSSEPFSLEKYQELVGRKYNRITFYICEADEFVGMYLYF